MKPRTEQLCRIAERFRAYCIKINEIPPTRIVVLGTVDHVSATHNLDLDALEAFPIGDFMHDVGGMLRYATLDGELTDCFWPRCGAKPKRGASS